MTRLISILLFIVLTACAHKPVPHTYLKYSGYIDGCAVGMGYIVINMNPDLTLDTLNMPLLDALCMDLYLERLEKENIKPPMKRLDINEVI